MDSMALNEFILSLSAELDLEFEQRIPHSFSDEYQFEVGCVSLHLNGSPNITHEVNPGTGIREAMAKGGTSYWDDLCR
jgi:hypothetical protein